MEPDDTPAQRAPARLRRWWLGTLAVVTLPFVELLVGTRSAVQGDNKDLHLPIFRWIWQSIRHGESPLWAGWAFGGQNVPGFGQGAMFYPLNAVFLWGDTVAAYRWWTLLHLWIAASGAFLWTWRKWGSAPGATVAGIVYGLNGQLLYHLVHVNFTMATVWFPWLLLGVDRLVRGGRGRDWWALVGPLYLIATAGHPQMLWAALVAAGTVAAFELVRNGRPRAAWLRCAGGLALGLGMAAAQLLPQLLYSRTSVRPDLTSTEALDVSARAGDLLTAAFPHLEGGGAGLPGLTADYRGNFYFHEVANHLGLAALILGMIAVVAHRRRRSVQALGALTVLAVVLALAHETPFGSLVFHVVPLADRFRIWPRYLVLGNLAMTGLAALGAATVLTAARRWSRPVAIAVVGSVVVAPVVVGFGDSLVSGTALVMALAVPLVGGGLLWAATAVGDDRRRWATAAVVASCALPSVVTAVAAPWRTESLTPSQADAFFDPSAAPWQPFDAPGGIDRWVNKYASGEGHATVRDTDRVDGYDPLLQSTFSRLTGTGYFGGVTGDVFWSGGWVPDVLRVTTLVAPQDTPAEAGGWALTTDTTDNREAIWHREPRLPEAYVAGAAEITTIDVIEHDLADPQADFAGTVRLDEATSGAFAGRTTPGSAGRVLSGGMDRHGHGSWVVDADRPGVLVISSAWLEGWSATVNGRAVPVARADGLVLAVPVEAGRNEVRLSFTPPGFRAGLLVSGAAAVAFAAVLATPVLVRRRRRRVHVTSG